MTTTADDPPHGRGMAWATLLVSAGISLGVNLWHAFDQAPDHEVTPWFAALAALYGTAPVVLAAFQSHSAAFVPMGKSKRLLTYLLVLLGMVLSVQAQAAAVAVFAGDYLKWIFPLLVDLSAFMALHTLMESARADRSVAPASDRRRFGWLVRRTGTRVPDGVPVQAPVWDAEPVPVRAAGPATVPDEPLERSVPDVPAGPVPAAEPVRTAGPDRDVPPVRPGPVPAAQTGTERPVQTGPARTGTPVRTDDVPAVTSPKDGDGAALEQLDAAFAGTAPADVTIGMVRRELGGAGFARAKRLHGLWLARTAAADRSGGRSGTGVDGPDREDGPEGEEEADRTADRVTASA